MSASRKRSFEMTRLDRTPKAAVAARGDFSGYEKFDPAEMLNPKFVKEFGHPVNETEADEEEALSEMVEKVNHFTVGGGKTAVELQEPRAFTRHEAFREIPDAVYEKIKTHPTIEFCEFGMEVGRSDAYLSSRAGIERNIRGRGYRFVTKAIQEAEIEEGVGEPSPAAADARVVDVTVGTGPPESIRAFELAQDAETLTSVIEDYCLVLIEDGKWFVVLKDL
jgi:hypothetical protein